MGIGLLNPGCECCKCSAWGGDPPVSQIQVTLPASCQRAGTHVLDRDAGDDYLYTSECPNTLGSTGISLADLCASYKLFIGTGAAQDTVVLNVGNTADGRAAVVIGVCNGLGSAGGTDAGNLWAMYVPGIDHWDDLDGLSVPWVAATTDTEGSADCTGPVDDATISFVP